MSVARSTSKLLISEFGASALGFLAIAYFARNLPSAQLGIFFLFQAIVSILAVVTDFGLRGATEKRMSENKMGNIMSTSIILKSIQLLFIILILIGLRSYINEYTGYPITIYIVVGLTIREYSEFFRQVLVGEHRVGETAGLKLARQSTWIISGIYLIHIGLGVEGLLTAFLLSYLIQLIWGIRKVSTSLQSPSLQAIPSLYRYSKYFVISQAGGRIYSWIDIAILGLFVINSEISIYEISWRVTLIILIISQSLANVIFPKVSKNAARNNISKIENIIPNALSASLFFSIPALFGAIILGRDTLMIVFGKEYGTAWIVLVILMGEKILQSPHRVLARVSEGIDKPEFGARTTIITIIVNIILNFTLIPLLGIVGAAVATLVSFGINTILHILYLSRYIDIRIPSRDIIWYILSSIVMASCIYVIRLVVEIESIMHLTIFITGGVLVYLLIVAVHPRIRHNIWKTGMSIISSKNTD